VWGGGGVRPQEVLPVLEAIGKVPRIRIDGLYTHLATADWTDPKFAWGQITQFRQTLEKVRHQGLAPATHVANSAALITYYPQSKGTWVRPGIALYGVYPNPSLKNRVKLTPVMQVRTRVLHVKDMERGESVSYGRTYRAPRRVKVATLAMGYADGVPRSLSNKGFFLIRGKKVPIVGTVCMDMTMVDVSRVRGIRAGDRALFFGKGLGVEEQAALAGTISYELLCGIGGRVPRVYV
ncbi:MAG TPA: alanine racemase, partial [bacterium]|nr:alanine racemase [bacterium]